MEEGNTITHCYYYGSGKEYMDIAFQIYLWEVEEFENIKVKLLVLIVVY